MKLGVTGIARSGKNVVADLLHKIYPNLPVKALATPIKSVFAYTLGWDERHMDGELKEEVIPYLHLDRETLITITANTYGVARVTATYAVNSLLVNLSKVPEVVVWEHGESAVLLQNTSPRMLFQVWGSEVWRELGGGDFWVELLPEDCIVSDVRFDNEAAAMDKTFKVLRPNLAAVARAHQSENGVSQGLVTETIMNDGTLQDLSDKVAIACVTPENMCSFCTKSHGYCQAKPKYHKDTTIVIECTEVVLPF